MPYYLLFFGLLSQTCFGFTLTQVTTDTFEIPWVMVGVLVFALCVSCILVYMYLLNRRLLRSKHKLSVLWHRIPDVLTEVDSDGVICAVNHQLVDNISIDDLVGTNSCDYLSAEDAISFRANLKRALSTGAEVEYEIVVTLGCNTRHLSNRIVPLISDEPGPRALVITTDISRHAEASKALHEAKIQAEETAKSKEDFLSRMSHEIRTPLGGMIGMANLLNESEGKGDFKQYSDTLLNTAHHLLQIVDDVLDLAKTDAGEIQLDEADVSLWQVLDDLEALYTPQATKKNISISIELSPEVPRLIRADAFRLRQVLYNLFNNAIKFTDSGSISLVVSMPVLVGTHTLRFAVIDTGVGVPKACQSVIFNAFSQADAKVSKQYGGTGLGLSICKNIVEIMGGTIGVNSEGHDGAEFWFTLPIRSMVTENPFKRDALTIVIAIGSEIKRLWFEAFLRSINIDYRVVDDSGDQDLEASYQLVITDRLLNTHATHWWWVGAESDVPDFESTVLYEPYGRQPLFNRISEYISDEARSAEGADLSYAETVEKTSDNNAQQLKQSRPSDMVQSNNLLVVEDNLINQVVIQKTLEKMGYEVSVANNGEEGVALFQSSSFQGVIMDVQMPVMDGIEATRQIRLVEDHYVPIIALTANAQGSVEQACFEAGVDAFLTKPINRAELQSTLDSVLGVETQNK